MNKRVLQVAVLCAAVCGASGIPQEASAQFWARAQAPRMPQTIEANPGKRPQSLKRILNELETRYRVTFAFDESLVQGRQAVAVSGRTLEESLTQVLTPLGLRYRKVKDNIYVVLESEKPAATPSSAATSEPKNAVAQAVVRRITGTVTDEAGVGLPGVNVLEEGTTNGTSTDAEGKFALNVSDEARRLVVSSIGYQSQTIDITSQTTLAVRLVEDNRTLNEVVVVGYGTQRRGDLTGAIGIVQPEEIKKVQTATVTEQLQGRIAGVNVTTTGRPGGQADVKIRGIGSFANSNPLYVIDGLQVGTPGQAFNPADVESIQVLKDASATALYGSRGMNGVIIITTKRGKSGTPRVDFATYAGVQSIPKRLDLMNAQEYIAANRVAYQNAGLRPQALRTDVDTDWQNEFFKNGLINDNTVTVSGGGTNANYLISANFFNQDGTVEGPNFKRYQIRANTGFTKGRFRIGQTLNIGRTYETRLNGNPFIDLMRMLPTIPVLDPTNPGGYGIGDSRGLDGATASNGNTFGTNPIGAQRLITDTRQANQVQGTLYGEVDILPFLTYRIQGSLEYYSYYDKYIRRYGRLSQNAPLDPNQLREQRGEIFNPQIEHLLTFNKDFGKHHVDALAGYTFYTTNDRYTRATVSGLSNDLWVPRLGTISPQVGGEEFASTLISYLGRVNYSYDGRYLAQVNFRRDGSSNFGANNKYGNFPSVSLGWRLSQEPFLQNTTAVSDLKLRASYGVVGNQAIPPYEIQQFIRSNVNYVLGPNQTIVPGATNLRLTNPNLRWESKQQIDLGVDAAFLSNRLTVTLDYFYAKSTDLLTRVPIPITAGSTGDNPFENIASVENKGIELQLGYTNKTTTGLQYGLTGTLAAVRNKVLGLVPANNNQPIFGWGNVTRTAVGRSIGEFFMLKQEGVFQTQAEIDNSPQRGQGFTPGDIRWADTNGRDENGNLTGQPDGVFNAEDDRTYVGSPFPKFEYSLNATAAWKGFDVTAYFYGVQGNSIFSPMAYWLGRYDDNGNYFADEPFWTGAGTSTTNPKPVIGDRTPNAFFNTTRWLSPGSYLRLRTFQLGYTVPAGLLQKTRAISTLRVYVAAQNLFTISKYKFYNPEVVGPDGTFGRGIDDGSYPGSRVITGGLQVSF
ncbi:SusC/RagA family TonB-linked outer membrane protein [Tellurirhabdus rosea]|uniref:SusC/RagA family TonB-linked outer membrane protein n=1 Tax=Tellurirhabdus rosea TaxID=2674997 RepID=UPI002257BA33|nr:SusC/RagA family TonB-linked outer membrane protein [Tellurirhabdus rosea]